MTVVVITVIVFFIVLSHVLEGVGDNFLSASKAIEHGLMALNKTG